MATPANPLPPGEGAPAAHPDGHVKGACPVCQSPIYVEAGVVKGGGPSEFFQDLKRKADSADSWREKAVALEYEHTSRDIDEPAHVDPAAPAVPAPADDVEYFL
jgi:hypothetical protein